MKKFSILKLVTILTAGLIISACTTTDAQFEKKKNNSGAAKANINLGIAYLRDKDLTKAKKSFIIAVQEAPNMPAAWYSLAYYEEITNNLKKADRYYKHAIKINPGVGAAHNNYGTFLCRTGEHKKAIQQFIYAAKLPQYIQVASAYENAGLCAMMIPNDGEAITYFKKALDNGPKRPTSLLEIAKLYLKLGNIKLAQRYYTRYTKVTKPTGESKRFAALLRYQEMLGRGHRKTLSTMLGRGHGKTLSTMYDGEQTQPTQHGRLYVGVSGGAGV